MAWALLAFMTAVVALLPTADVVPAAPIPQEAGAAARPHDRVVVFMIDGLGRRVALAPGAMPKLQDRLPKSAVGTALAVFPTITSQGLRTMFSGHEPIPQPDFPGGIKDSAEPDSVLKRAAAAGLRVCVVGQYNWPALFSGHGESLINVPYHGLNVVTGADGRREVVDDYDERVLAAAEPWLAGKDSCDLLVLHIFEQDPIGHLVGTADPLYRKHLLWVDDAVDRVSRRLAAQRPTTFILLADHGMTRGGTHGGMTAIEREVPLVIWGARTKPADLGVRPLYDAAPTIAALLGVPPPVMTQGLPALEGLTFSDKERAEVWLDLLRQRHGRWDSVRRVLPWVKGDPVAAESAAQTLMAQGRFKLAASTAQKGVQEVDTALENALPKEWFGRLILAVWALVIAAALSLVWPARPRTRKAVLAACAALLVAVLIPYYRPGDWGLASAAVEGLAIVLLALSVSAGLDRPSGISLAAWGAWVVALLAICRSDFVDVPIWAGAVVCVAFLLALARRRKAALLWGALAVAARLLLSWARPSHVASLARGLLPPCPLPPPANWLWVLGRTAGLAALAAALVFRLRRSQDRGPWPVAGLAALPAAVALMAGAQATPAVWLILGACSVSAAACAVAGRSGTRGYWLSLIALVYFDLFSIPRQTCLLSFAVAAGWALCWDPDPEGNPLFEGLTMVGLALWGFTSIVHGLDFLSVNISSGERAFGGWHPRLLVALLLMKFLVAAGAPIMPTLARRRTQAVLAILPLLGMRAAGDMSMLWWDRFMQGDNLRFIGQQPYIGLVTVLTLAWGLIALWALARLARRGPFPLRPEVVP